MYHNCFTYVHSNLIILLEVGTNTQRIIEKPFGTAGTSNIPTAPVGEETN